MQTSASGSKPEETFASTQGPLMLNEVNSNPPGRGKCSTIFTGFWVVTLCVFCLYFFIDKSFKSKLLVLAQDYGTANVGSVSFMITVETMMLMFGATASIPEIISAFLFKDYLLTFVMAIVARQLAGILTFIIGRFVMRATVDRYLKSFKVYKLLEYMLNKSPFKTILILRVTLMPTFVKYYGLPAMGASFWYINISILLTSCIISNFYLLPGYFARTAEEVESGQFEWRSRMLLLGSVLFYACMLGTFAAIMRREMKQMEHDTLCEDDVDIDGNEKSVEINIPKPSDDPKNTSQTEGDHSSEGAQSIQMANGYRKVAVCLH